MTTKKYKNITANGCNGRLGNNIVLYLTFDIQRTVHSDIFL